MNSNIKDLALIGLPALWAACASTYIVFSEREKRMFLSGASVFRPWLLAPAVLHFALLVWVSHSSSQRLFTNEPLGILATVTITALPMLALLAWRLLDEENKPGKSATKMPRTLPRH